ncbi:MAG: alanine--tRNA ligase [Pseudobacteriovorax sp.]|nr:alanine--tRNA ligase [Pseudobacteriovorax sp.]
MKVAEIRESFLKFFAERQHERVESSSLIPENDPTLMFANAGMNQFKDVFLGRETRSYTKATTCQKCVRAGGKHNDLENVGYTARHHTFFEMLGNFSFGDYFKKDAIRHAWDYCTKVLKVDQKDVYVTVYKTDDEAANIWEKDIGFPKDKIIRLGEEDNFWSMGDVGPCGPCSEMFFDRGEQYCAGEKQCGIGKCDCDRYMEFWNLVFMQYDRAKDGTMTPLPKPSVDTGMGLERMAGILQKTETNYEIDCFVEIFDAISKLLGKTYDPAKEDVFNFRVIADHARSITFLIADGVMPSNEGRGYVLRRIIRRAVRYGKNLGFDKPFLFKICAAVVSQMESVYPNLKDKRALLDKAVKAEEEQFLKTLEKGLSLLDESLAELPENGQLSGDIAFKLYDTFGFPIDLTRLICEERLYSVDEVGFEASMEKQKSQSRKSWKGNAGDNSNELFHALAESLPESKFAGHDSLALEGKLLAIIQHSGTSPESVDVVSQKGAEVDLVFDETPFYPEGGGQVGDRGLVTDSQGAKAQVLDVKKPVTGLLVVSARLEAGSLKVGSSYQQETNQILRNYTARNHTATHLLHWALRDTLGDHVKQAGSLVNENSLRFDFSHFQGMTAEEIKTIETKINEKIWQRLPVVHQVMGKDEAIAAGAIAFFGEKYGDKVRVVSVSDFSVELCGGSHVVNTSEINLFKITSESSIAAGVRRITAVTSKMAFDYLAASHREVESLTAKYKVKDLSAVGSKLEKSLQNEKELQKKLEDQSLGVMLNELSELVATATEVSGSTVVAYECSETLNGGKTLRDLAERLTQKHKGLVLLLAMKMASQEKAMLLVAKGKEVDSKLKAGNLIKELAPHIDGRGGGKPDMAQAGGSKLSGVKQALEAFPDLVASTLGA